MAGYNADTMSWQVPDTDTVYVDGLPQGITEKDVEEFFGSIGIIKTDKKTRGKKIWLYRDKATGALKGDGTVSYEDPFSAGSAVEWFNGKDWKGVFGPRAEVFFLYDDPVLVDCDAAPLQSSLHAPAWCSSSGTSMSQQCAVDPCSQVAAVKCVLGCSE